MEQKVFIHTNNMQSIGATLAKFAIERKLPAGSPIAVEILNVDNRPEFKAFAGKTYLRVGQEVTYNPNDLQSFTLSRFMPPELMGYTGRSIVIDPDIFALADITPLMNIDLEGAPLAACPKHDAWDTSCMVMENAKLTHWKINTILSRLQTKDTDYLTFSQLREEQRVTALSRDWNSLDSLTPSTKMVHMTNRMTQPWSTGLKIDFTLNKMPKLLGIIPREPIHKLLGKYPTHYKKHPDPKIEAFFIELAKDAYAARVIDDETIATEIKNKRLRPDFMTLIKN